MAGPMSADEEEAGPAAREILECVMESRPCA